MPHVLGFCCEVGSGGISKIQVLNYRRLLDFIRVLVQQSYKSVASFMICTGTR